MTKLLALLQTFTPRARWWALVLKEVLCRPGKCIGRDVSVLTRMGVQLGRNPLDFWGQCLTHLPLSPRTTPNCCLPLAPSDQT